MSDTIDIKATIRSFSVNVLNSDKRCDRCGAQAFIKVTMPETGYELLFCAHHFGDSHDKLVSIEGAFIDDYSRALEVEVEEAKRKLGTA